MWKSSDQSYSAAWSFSDDTDAITFTVQTRQPQSKWTAIGFAPKSSVVCKF